MIEGKFRKKRSWKVLLVAFLSLSLLAGFFLIGAEEKAGKIFVIAVFAEAKSMDPHEHADYTRAIVRMNMYDGLTRFQGSPPVLKPWLAESWEVGPAAKEWTFHLRKGVLFHDGSEMTAEDVVYSTEKLLHGGKGMAGTLSKFLKSGATEAVDKYTVKFHLTQPFSPFAGFTQFIFVLNKDVLQRHEENGDYGNKWLATNGTRLGKDGVGTGAYVLTEWEPGSYWTCEKFDDYFNGWNQPHLSEVRVELVYETATRIVGLKKGTYHFSPVTKSYVEMQDLMKSPLLQDMKAPSPYIKFNSINNRRPPTSDVHFRKAILYAYDYDTIIEDLMHGYMERNIGYIPNALFGSLDPDKEFHYSYDLDKAREELAKCEIDYKKYEPLVIGICKGVEFDRVSAEMMVAGLNQLGIEATMKYVTWPTYCEEVAKPETAYHIGILGLSPFYIDPDHWSRLADGRAFGTYIGASWYENPTVSKLHLQALEITDEGQRAKLYQEAQRIVLQEAGLMPIAQANYYNALNKDVGGAENFCPYGGLQEFRRLYFKSEWE